MSFIISTVGGILSLFAFYFMTNNGYAPDLVREFPEFLSFTSGSFWFICGVGLFASYVALPVLITALIVAIPRWQNSNFLHGLLLFAGQMIVTWGAFKWFYSSNPEVLLDVIKCMAVASAIECTISYGTILLFDDEDDIEEPVPYANGTQASSPTANTSSAIQWRPILSYCAAAGTFEILSTSSILLILSVKNIQVTTDMLISLLTSCGVASLLAVLVGGRWFLKIGISMLAALESDFPSNKTYEGACFGTGFALFTFCVGCIAFGLVPTGHSVWASATAVFIITASAALSGVPFGMLRENREYFSDQGRLSAIFR